MNHEEFTDLIKTASEKVGGHGLFALLGGGKKELKVIEEYNPGCRVTHFPDGEIDAVVQFEPDYAERFWALKRGFMSAVAPSMTDEDKILFFHKKMSLFKESLITAASATSVFNRSWQENSLKNIPAIADSMPLSRLFGKWQKKPVMMLGGGPSLDRELENIRRCQGRLLLVACGTSLRWCNHHGIRPDLVVAIDPGEANYSKHFVGNGLKDVPLVFDHRCHYKVARSWPGPRFACSLVANSYVERLVLERSLGVIGDSGPSVMNAMFLMVKKFGAAPIFLIGQDLCWYTDKIHAENCHNGASPTNEHYDKVFCQGVDSERVETSPTMRQMANFYARRLKKEDRVVNLSRGLHIPHTVNAHLSDVVGILEKRNVSISPRMLSKKPKVKPWHLIRNLGKIRKTAVNLKDMAEIEYESLINYQEFNYIMLPMIFSRELDPVKIAEFVRPRLDQTILWIDEVIEEIKEPSLSVVFGSRK